MVVVEVILTGTQHQLLHSVVESSARSAHRN